MAEFEDRYWTSEDGLRLHYRDYPGPADKAPVVCLPGLTRNARDYEDLAGALAGKRRVLCLDFRGRGDSDYAKDPASYVPPTYMADLAALLEQTGIERFVAIATSLGGLVTMLFALMFRVLPDVRLRWRDVFAGALLTAVLFTAGRHLIGQYLGRVGVGQRYGASRSFVALLVWVYYSAQILFLGAEFTKVWSRRHGVRVVPTQGAVPVTEEARAQAGISHKEVVQAVTEVVERKEADGAAEPGKTIRMEPRKET